ncbi:MAG: NAD(P)H-hydrate dehydratase [Beijerinckiaceae bacterium]
MGLGLNRTRVADGLLSVAQMREADRLTIAGGVAGIALMELAGAAVAARAKGRLAPGGQALVLCGPGYNGGDGFIAARLLAAEGYQVTVGLLGERTRLQGDAALAAERWMGPVAPADPALMDCADLIVDGLFGAGLARPLDGAAAALVEAVNASGKPVIAVDIPSGVHGDSGQVKGIAIKATETVTFFRRKPGHMLMPGRALCGPVVCADIGIDAAVLAQTGIVAHVNGPDVWRGLLPSLRNDGHKYHRGHALVIGGGLEGVGAPRLSARAALRIGAGLVTLGVDPDALVAHTSRGPDALMVRSSPVETLLAYRRHNAVVIGPALGVDARARSKVSAALRADCACVLDADALTVMARRTGMLARAGLRKPVILTPHDGEFSRLFNGLDENSARVNPVVDAMSPKNVRRLLMSESKLDRAKDAAQATQAFVVLKGADTVIAAPDGRAAINANAPPWLATAGAGDVLAGMICGLLAQGMPAFEAACAAVWIHGDTATRLGRGLIADDLVDRMVWPEE